MTPACRLRPRLIVSRRAALAQTTAPSPCGCTAYRSVASPATRRARGGCPRRLYRLHSPCWPRRPLGRLTYRPTFRTARGCDQTCVRVAAPQRLPCPRCHSFCRDADRRRPSGRGSTRTTRTPRARTRAWARASALALPPVRTTTPSAMPLLAAPPNPAYETPCSLGPRHETRR